MEIGVQTITVNMSLWPSIEGSFSPKFLRQWTDQRRKTKIVDLLTLAREKGFSQLELEVLTHLSPPVLTSLLDELANQGKILYLTRWYKTDFRSRQGDI